MKRKWYLTITAVFLVMGILLSLQFRAQENFASGLTMQRTENLIAMVRDLSSKRQNLSFEILDLTERLTAQKQAERDDKQLVSNIANEMNKLNIITGATELIGPGLTITIDRYMPILYIDIINIVNELWAAGAEAISINDQRVTANSAIFYAENSNNVFLTVNNHTIDYPVVIMAIGDAANLEKGLTIPGGIMDNLALFGAYPVLEKKDETTVVARNDTPHFYFLKEYKPEDTSSSESKPAANNQIHND